MCAILLTVSSAFCGTAFAAPLQGTEKAAVSAESALHVDSSRWNYDKDNDIYYQIGLVYCKNPAASEYESLSVYVPGAYMKGTPNADGTYTCQISDKGKVGEYTARTAPVIMPVNTG